MKRIDSNIVLMLISVFLLFNSCKKNIDIFSPLTVLENIELGSEFMALTAEGETKIATQYTLGNGANGTLQLNAVFEDIDTQNESIFVYFRIPQNGIGSYALSGVPFELSYKGKTIIDWKLDVNISEFGTNSQDRITGMMSGNINVVGLGVLPIMLHFSVKRS